MVQPSKAQYRSRKSAAKISRFTGLSTTKAIERAGRQVLELSSSRKEIRNAIDTFQLGVLSKWLITRILFRWSLKSVNYVQRFKGLKPENT